ncbi:MAG TPA: bifunctional homocysteine S-methyltransferase/methylenetetrahydrofolate reductase [Chthoniobacteraceae bacterium]|jgi:homocysteine S-methyltransferase|nr:bifunctional homocysteine S-methyltransferase/methylenetetrahydrofolate reductase [Chthoniobacteraceae bacterium]
MDLLDELQEKIVPGDGAMGTMILEAGVPLERCFEELCVSQPDVIRGIHERYIAAGARLIETNSFGANGARLAKYGFERQVNEINWTAAKLARETARGKDVYVAGSVGPLGLTEEQARAQGIDRKALFQEQIGALLDGGVDLIFFETFTDLDEMLLALYVKQSLHHCPAVCSMACTEEGRLPSGMPLVAAFEKLRAADAQIVGANCLNGPHAMLRLFQKLPIEGLLSAFPNAGYPKYHDGRYLYFTSPEYFANTSRELAAEGARLIGGCCGIGPSHIAAMVEALKELKPATTKVTVEETLPAVAPAAAVSSAPCNILELVKAGKTVVMTELDPPKTLDLEKYFTGAKALTEAGSDVITLADNSLAILRVSNLAVGAILKQRYNIDPLLHLSCRDRNLIGLQSELMGMAAMGIHHVLPLTGDPAKVGDHPGAASVYDVSSIELIGIIKRMNEGVNYTGKPIKMKEPFIFGCTFNPNAKNMDAQVSRLERKVAAGAQYVMTQPVFEHRLVEEMHRRTQHLNVPIFTGVWPLLNGRQAEFLHNEVPGIVIPEHVRARMSGKEGVEGRKQGIELAKDICRAAMDLFPGVYLITPFVNYDTTVELAHFVRGGS